MQNSFHLGNRPQLDGLRAAAILLVMGYHAFSEFYEEWYPGRRPPLGGGFIGVDIFFALSGFLITTLLLQEWEAEGRIDLKRFYLKRARRLYPALLLLLAVFLLVFPLLRLTPFRAVAYTVVTLTYTSNWFRAFDVVNPRFLGHSWSLAAEAQFYLLWPCALIGTFRMGGRRALFILALSLAAGSWIWRVYLWQRGVSPGRIYNGLDTRADGLLLGCAAGVLLTSSWRAKLERGAANFAGFAAVGSLLALLSFAFVASPFAAYMVYWGYAFNALLSVILILALVLDSGSVVSRFLAHPAMVWLGTLSYGLYLWHYPILQTLARVVGVSYLPMVILLGGGLSVICAYVSYYLVEKKFLRPRA